MALSIPVRWRYAALVALLIAIPVGLSKVPSSSETPTSNPEPANGLHTGMHYATVTEAQGSIRGQCQANLVAFPGEMGGHLTGTSGGGFLQLHTVRVNSTIFAATGERVILDRASEESVISLPPGALTLRWESDGLVQVSGRDASGERLTPLSLEFEVATYHADPMFELPTYKPHFEEEMPRHGLALDWAGRLGGRDLSLRAGQAYLTGTPTLWVDGGEVSAKGIREQIPPFQEILEETETPLGSYRSEVYHFGILELQQARLAVDPVETKPICQAVDAAVDGTYSARPYDGPNVRVPDWLAPSDSYEMRGQFEIQERVDASDWEQDRFWFAQHFQEQRAPDSVTSSLGFETASRTWTSPQRIAIWVVVTSGILLLWKGSTLLFTRLREDSLMDHPRRRDLEALIRNNPGIDLSRLLALSGISRSDARHHLRVLERHGRIRSFKLQAVWRFAPSDTDLRALRHRVLLDADPMMASLLALVRTQAPLPAYQAVERLQAGSGLSRAGAWKVVSRGIRLNVVPVERRGRSLYLLSQPDAPTSKASPTLPSAPESVS